MNVKKVCVTKAMAKKWLENNDINRPLKVKWVKELARRMTSGEWAYNGDVIRLSNSGKLMDGQHRLQAIIDSDSKIDMLVVTDLCEDVFHTIDVGARRGFADVLSILGNKNCNLLGATCTNIWKYETNKFTRDFAVHPSHETLLDVLSKHPGVIEVTDKFVGCTQLRRLGVPSGVNFICYAFFRCCKSDMVERWYSELTGETPTSKSDPTWMLRERLLRNKESKAKLPMQEVMAIAIKAANAFYSGLSPKFLRWSKDAGEDFPRLLFWE